MFLSVERLFRHDLETPPALVQWKAGREIQDKGSRMPDAIKSHGREWRDHRSRRTRPRAAHPVPASRHRHRSGSACADRACQRRPCHRAVASRIWNVAIAKGHDHGRRRFVFLSRSSRRPRSARRAGGRRRPRRLARGRDRHEKFLAAVAPGHGQRRRRQDRRPRDPRHRRHLGADAGRIQRARIFRSEGWRARLQEPAGGGIAGRCAEPRGLCAARLVALHAQPQAQEPAAPHQAADAVSLGHGRPRAEREIRPRLLRPDCRREIRADREGRPLPPHRAAGRIRPPGAGLRRRRAAPAARAKRA